MPRGHSITPDDSSPARRHWARLLVRCARLWLRPHGRTADLVTAGYNRIAAGYDSAWTTHMRELSLRMLSQLDLPSSQSDRPVRALDLTCGTGFVAQELSGRTDRQVIGVDASAGMLTEARTHHAERCTFVQSDVLSFLRSQRSASADVITCAWGLGYLRPMAVVRQIARVLRPGGQVGIIDNALTSLREVLWCSVLAFAERPDALRHVMNVRFLPGSRTLAGIMRLQGLAVHWRADGAKTYHVPDGRAAIDRLTATGAAAGFESAAGDEQRHAIFERFAQIIEQRCSSTKGVTVTHRWLAVTGERPAR